jgi:hypothetical protein
MPQSVKEQRRVVEHSGADLVHEVLHVLHAFLIFLSPVEVHELEVPGES